MKTSRILAVSPLVVPVLLAGLGPAQAITLPDTGSSCTAANGGSGCFKVTNNNNTASTFAITGQASGAGAGLAGTSASGTGVVGTTTSGVGVQGSCSSMSPNAIGVQGITTGTGASQIGVKGTSTTGYGIYGQTFRDSTDSASIYGYTATQGANAILGVQAGNDSGTAILGKNTDSAGNLVSNGTTIIGLGGGTGVKGAGFSVGVFGIPTNTTAATGVSGMVDPACGSNCNGVQGDAQGGWATGVSGTSGYGNGVSGSSTNGRGVYGTGAAQGVYAYSVSGQGVYAYSGSSNGLVAVNAVTDTSAAAVSAIPGSTSALAYWGSGGIELSGSYAAKVGGGMWSAASDRRIKKDVRDLDSGLAELMRVHPVSFKYNGLGGTEDDGKERVGVIAQELEQILPSMVSSKAVKLHKGDAEDTKIEIVDPSAFTYVLINAVKQQQWIIEKQGDRIAALERHQAPVTSSLFSGGIGTAMGLVLLPVGLVAARRRRKDGARA